MIIEKFRNYLQDLYLAGVSPTHFQLTALLDKLEKEDPLYQAIEDFKSSGSVAQVYMLEISYHPNSKDIKLKVEDVA